MSSKKPKEKQSRLDRLLQIVDTGSTPATRKVAAEQIGAVQKQHPHELYNLLRRWHVTLQSHHARCPYPRRDAHATKTTDDWCFRQAAAVSSKQVVAFSHGSGPGC